MAGSPSSRQTMWFLLVLVLLLIGVGLLQFTEIIGVGDSNIAWTTDYDQARRQARIDGRKVLVYFTADWCPPCQKMRRSVWTNDKVEALIARYYVPVKVEMPRQKDDSPAWQLARQFGVEQIPAIFVVEPSGLKSDLRGLQGWRQVYGFLGANKPQLQEETAPPS